MAIKPWEQVPLINGVWKAFSDDGVWVGAGVIPAAWFKGAGLSEGTDQLAIVKHIPAKYAKLPNGSPQSVNPLRAAEQIGRALGLTVDQARRVVDYLERVKQGGGQLPQTANPQPGNPNSPIPVGAFSVAQALDAATGGELDPLLIDEAVAQLEANGDMHVLDGGVISIPLLIMLIGAGVQVVNGLIQASATIYDLFSKQEVLPFMWSEYAWLDGSVTAIYAGWWYGSALKLHHIGCFGPGGEREARIRKWTAELASMQGMQDIRRAFPRYPIIAMPVRAVRAAGEADEGDEFSDIQPCSTQSPVSLPVEAITHRPQLILPALESRSAVRVADTRAQQAQHNITTLEQLPFLEREWHGLQMDLLRDADAGSPARAGFLRANDRLERSLNALLSGAWPQHGLQALATDFDRAIATVAPAAQVRLQEWRTEFFVRLDSLQAFQADKAGFKKQLPPGFWFDARVAPHRADARRYIRETLPPRYGELPFDMRAALKVACDHCSSDCPCGQRFESDCTHFLSHYLYGGGIKAAGGWNSSCDWGLQTWAPHLAAFMEELSNQYSNIQRHGYQNLDCGDIGFMLNTGGYVFHALILAGPAQYNGAPIYGHTHDRCGEWVSGDFDNAVYYRFV
jgi:hypothetical protein